MAQEEAIKLFEENKLRVFFDDVEEQWYFCILDVIKALTDATDPSDYFKKMRRRDAELNEFVQGTNCPPVQVTPALAAEPLGRERGSASKKKISNNNI